MFGCNGSVHLKSSMLSDCTRTFEKDILPLLPKQNGMRNLIVGGMLLGLLTGMCFAQRASQQPSPSARPAPSATTLAPTATAVAPNTTAVAPNTTAVAPNTTAVAPNTTAVAPNTTAVAPNTTMAVPDATTVGPDATAVAPNATMVVPDVNTVGPRDMIQKPPIPPNTGVSPDAAPPSVQH